jgi:hypothetical protein
MDPGKITASEAAAIRSHLKTLRAFTTGPASQNAAKPKRRKKAASSGDDEPLSPFEQYAADLRAAQSRPDTQGNQGETEQAMDTGDVGERQSAAIAAEASSVGESTSRQAAPT